MGAPTSPPVSEVAMSHSMGGNLIIKWAVKRAIGCRNVFVHRQKRAPSALLAVSGFLRTRPFNSKIYSYGCTIDSEGHRRRMVTTHTIAPEILVHFPHLNAEQHSAISQTNEPLLVIAGPGSGKTLVLVLRMLNMLLHGLAQPSELLFTTFTEKSAYELRDRVAIAATQIGYNGDLSSLRVGTIHGICNDFLQRYRQLPFWGMGTKYSMS